MNRQLPTTAPQTHNMSWIHYKMALVKAGAQVHHITIWIQCTTAIIEGRQGKMIKAKGGHHFPSLFLSAGFSQLKHVMHPSNPTPTRAFAPLHFISGHPAFYNVFVCPATAICLWNCPLPNNFQQNNALPFLPNCCLCFSKQMWVSLDITMLPFLQTNVGFITGSSPMSACIIYTYIS